jgi:CheY-like chemotaxis protein
MSKRILIVDDEEDVRAITKMGLEMGAGWTVFTASSGKEAIAIAEKQQPDVILLDVMMPDMDGYKTLQQLKGSPLTQSIPVILATAKAQPSEAGEGLTALGAAAIFAKPYRPLKLAEQIVAAIA